MNSVFLLLLAREARLLFRRPAELANPLVFGGVLLVVVIVMWLVIWALWRFLKAIFRRLRGTGDAQEPLQKT